MRSTAGSGSSILKNRRPGIDVSAVTLVDVGKSFGATEVIRGVSLDIPDGAFVVLVGPSGCGKSTLLRMIAGLEAIDRGAIRIGDRIVNQIAPKDRDVAMVFQNYALYPHMTVAGNMGFSLKLRGERADIIARKVADAAAILGLEPYLDRLPRQLSGGQRQRVAMGRAIVRAPRVFLFDEPLSNLDAGLRAQMRTEIKDLHQRLQTTTVYVTHDQIEAMTMGDTIVVLRDGVVQQVGPPLDVYDRPANLFTARFIGSPAMNILDAEVDTADADTVLRLAGGATVPLPRRSGLESGRRVQIGIRPEHLVFADDGLDARALVVEPTGAATHVTLALAESTVVAVVRERVMLSRGSTVKIAVRPESIHVFDPTTGERIEVGR
jgi:multiple sugar transport system ATP-binding protein